MAQIRIEQKRTGPIWIAAIIILIIVVVVVWLYVRHWSAAPAATPATSITPAVFQRAPASRAAPVRLTSAPGVSRGALPEPTVNAFPS